MLSNHNLDRLVVTIIAAYTILINISNQMRLISLGQILLEVWLGMDGNRQLMIVLIKI